MRQVIPGRKALATGLALAVMMPAGMASAQDDAPPPSASVATEDAVDSVPLEVTIRPRYRELKDGEVVDAIIRLNDRQYMLYSGWYVDDMGARLRAPGEAPPLSGLADALGSVLGSVALDYSSNYGGDYSQMRRYGLNRDNVALELGTRFQGMSYVDIALSFDVDPFPQPIGFAPGRGIYGRRAFNSDYSAANQTLGTINLITPEGPGAEFYFQIAPDISQLMAALSE